MRALLNKEVFGNLGVVLVEDTFGAPLLQRGNLVEEVGTHLLVHCPVVATWAGTFAVDWEEPVENSDNLVEEEQFAEGNLVMGTVVVGLGEGNNLDTDFVVYIADNPEEAEQFADFQTLSSSAVVAEPAVAEACLGLASLPEHFVVAFELVVELLGC